MLLADRTIEAGAAFIILVAIVGLYVIYRTPARIRPVDITAPGDREAFRGNLIQTWTLILIVVGAVVALVQLRTTLDQLTSERSGQLAVEVNNAIDRLRNEQSDLQDRRDAITDLTLLHSKSSDHRFAIERELLRYVQEHARRKDESAESQAIEPPADIQAALQFVVTEGQEQTEEGWQVQAAGPFLDLSNLDLHGLDLRWSNLNEADLRGSLLQQADLRDARMAGATLVDANLEGARLQQAVLSGSVLSNAELINTSFTGADLAGSDLRGARNVTWEQIRDVTCPRKLVHRY